MNNQAINAGVHAVTGFEFQKHCALYILLENWENYKDRKYFICIEHHDDFLFCHQTESNLIESINTYQAKKSSTKWTLTQGFYEILQKILEVGSNLRIDTSLGKIPDYKQELSFLSNEPTSLKLEKNNIIINVENDNIKFNKLDSEIQKKVKDGIEKINPDLSEIDNLAFSYIDFSKTAKSQINQLVGMFGTVFNKQVLDHRAAVQTLLILFKDIELTFNQGASVQLLDSSKSLDSIEINNAIDIITTQKKAFDLWRSKKSEIARILKVPKPQQDKFELHFENSFDYFKDLVKVEHQKIFNFTKNNPSLFTECYNDTECIDLLYNEAIKKEVLRQDELHLKAALFAAYVEIVY